jgi:hypothetical protein
MFTIVDTLLSQTADPVLLFGQLEMAHGGPARSGLFEPSQGG